MSNTLDLFFKKNKINVSEGSINQTNKQVEEIKKILSSNSNFKNIMEIGFNAGHSAELFLENTNAHVYSFDIGTHFNEYLKYGKIFINQKFPNRHTLIFGDSVETIPRFISNNDVKFDLIFIDGGHDFHIAYADLINCRKLSHEKTIVIMDDIVENEELEVGYTIGPKQAWNEMKKQNLILETSHSDFEFGKGHSIGYYVFN